MISGKSDAIRQLYQDIPNVADYLTKPFAINVIRAVVSHILTKRDAPSAEESSDEPVLEGVASVVGSPTKSQEQDELLLSIPGALLPGTHVLSYLGQEKASGVLIIEKDGTDLDVYFSNGFITGVGCNQPKVYCAGLPYPFQNLPHPVIAEAVRLQQESKIPFFLTVWNLQHHPTDLDLKQLLVKAALRVTARNIYQSTRLLFEKTRTVPEYIRQCPIHIPVFSMLI